MTGNRDPRNLRDGGVSSAGRSLAPRGGAVLASARSRPGAFTSASGDTAMALDKATVANIARLARIRVPEEDMDRLAEELSHILGWIEQLDEVDTEGTRPMSSVVEMALKMREDRVTDGGYSQDVLANAPRSADGFYTVPKVIE